MPTYYITLPCLAAACANLFCKLYAAVFCEPPPKPSKNDIASSATMIDFKSSLPDCGGEGDEKNIEMSTDCFLCKKCLFTFVPCRMDVTLKTSKMNFANNRLTNLQIFYTNFSSFLSFMVGILQFLTGA